MTIYINIKFLTALAIVSITGCANKPSYINPQPSTTDVKIVFGGEMYKDRLPFGSIIPRVFAVNLDEKSLKHCEAYEYSSRVISSKNIWGETHEEKSITVPPGRRIGVMGQYTVLGTDGRTFSCGPIISSFIPDQGNKYHIDLDVRDGSCRLIIKKEKQGVPSDVDVEFIGKICNRQISN